MINADVLAIANWYVENGISVIPVRADGSKAPMHAGWRKYSNEMPTQDELAMWFSGGHLVGIGVPCGPASGNLVVLDFECDGESAYFEWLRRLPDSLIQQVQDLPTVITPSGGRHIWVRLSQPQPGGRLAKYQGGKTKIEIRGEGHQVLAPGCPAECHKSGRLYEWTTAPESFPVVSDELWHDMVMYACECNDQTQQEQPRDGANNAAGGKSLYDDSPGTDFNIRGTWAETGLFDHGWSWCRQSGNDCGTLTRPGKLDGVSATVGNTRSQLHGYPYLYVFSTSTDFSPDTPYSRFAVYALLNHAGNFVEAAKALKDKGYGGREGVKIRQNNMKRWRLKVGDDYIDVGGPAYDEAKHDAEEAKAIEERMAKEKRLFKWASELSTSGEEAKWIWEGFLPRGGITLFSALWKAGKSTILSHLIKALDGKHDDFLGHRVVPSRVLYVTEEHEDIWSERRDNLQLADHIGFMCRPFPVRPNMNEWREAISQIAEQVELHAFDLVIIDTLAKMWPVKDENDAGQVDEALMPLWNVAKKNAAVLLVHHSRKSGGTEFVGARGSGALAAFCDLLMEFGRETPDHKNSRRIITSMGRYRETPPKVLCDLTPLGYVGLGDPDDIKEATTATNRARKKEEWEGMLQEVLSESGESWSSFAEIEKSLIDKRGGSMVQKSDLKSRLDSMISGGELERKGEGKKGNPYLYKLPEVG